MSSFPEPLSEGLASQHPTSQAPGTAERAQAAEFEAHGDGAGLEWRVRSSGWKRARTAPLRIEAAALDLQAASDGDAAPDPKAARAELPATPRAGRKEPAVEGLSRLRAPARRGCHRRLLGPGSSGSEAA